MEHNNYVNSVHIVVDFTKQNINTQKNLLFLQSVGVCLSFERKCQDFAFARFSRETQCCLFYTTSADLAEDTLKVQMSSNLAFSYHIIYWMGRGEGVSFFLKNFALSMR